MAAGLKTRKLSFLGLLIAAAVALNALESLVPTPLPWVRLGLANLLTLVAILTCGWKEGFVVTIMRVVISSLLIGGFLGPGFLLSLGGGLAGTMAMCLLAPGAWRLYSPIAVSVAGAFAHGTAQVALLGLVLVQSWEVVFFLPWVLVPALLSGMATGILANIILVRRRDFFQTFGRMPHMKSGSR